MTWGPALRLSALLALLCFALAPAAVLAQPPQGKTAALADPAYAAFEAAIAETKAAMMASPDQALAKSRAAIARAAALPPSREARLAMSTARWLQAESYLYLNNPAAAGPIVDEALATVTALAPSSKLRGDLLRSRGALAAMAGRVHEALTDYQTAFKVFQAAGETRSQAIALQDIGQIYWDAGDFPRVLQYYQQAGELYTADPAFSLTSHNNRAEVLRKLGRHGEAEEEYAAALANARALKSPLLEVRILSNLAIAQVENKRIAAAEATVRQALRLSQAGEAAGWKPFVYGAAAKVAVARGELVRAAALLSSTFAGPDLAKTQMPFKEFHETAAQVFEKLGNQPLALAHLKAFQRLESEARNLTASASSQLMSARFDFANQNLRISQLKQGQLERDIRIERQQSQFRTVVLTGLIAAGTIVFALLLVSALRIRRSRNQVRAANIVLAETNAALEKALRAKTEFLATTSHEIRTPLNGILGMTQILLSNKAIDAEVREQVAVVHGAGETMRALVDDILDVAKMETGEIAVAHEPTDLRRILEDAARLWRGHAAAKGLALELDIEDAPPVIRSDGARIRQIVFNLLSNAVKFTPQGSVHLVARAECEDAPQLVLEVRDTGIGIAEENQPLIFQAFHQVDGGTTRQFSGTGLGLAICRNLAEALGGAIAVHSVPGQGSVFTVRLPLEAVEGAVSAPAVQERPVALEGARLLLVEANVMIHGVMRSLLEPAVGAIDCVEDGNGALVALAVGTVDHLLVEAGSAAVAGLGPVDSLRAVVDAANAAGIPVTLLLAPSDTLPLGDIAQLGATQLVLKPVGGKQLVQTLREAYPAPDGAAAAADSSRAA